MKSDEFDTIFFSGKGCIIAPVIANAILKSQDKYLIRLNGRKITSFWSLNVHITTPFVQNVITTSWTLKNNQHIAPPTTDDYHKWTNQPTNLKQHEVLGLGLDNGEFYMCDLTAPQYGIHDKNSYGHSIRLEKLSMKVPFFTKLNAKIPLFAPMCTDFVSESGAIESNGDVSYCKFSYGAIISMKRIDENHVNNLVDGSTKARTILELCELTTSLIPRK